MLLRLFSSQKGFTLIEIMVVISSIVVISGFGFAALVSSQRKQEVDQTAGNIKQHIDNARFNTISRVKPQTGCAALVSYNVRFRADSVLLVAVCQNSVGTQNEIIDSTYTFPSNVSLSITNSGCNEIQFLVLSNVVSCTSGTTLPQLRVEGYGNTRNISIDNSGNSAIL